MRFTILCVANKRFACTHSRVSREIPDSGDRNTSSGHTIISALCESSLTGFTRAAENAVCASLAREALYITSLCRPRPRRLASHAYFCVCVCVCIYIYAGTRASRVYVRISNGRDERRLLRGRSCSFNGPRVLAALSVGSLSLHPPPKAKETARVRTNTIADNEQAVHARTHARNPGRGDYIVKTRARLDHARRIYALMNHSRFCSLRKEPMINFFAKKDMDITCQKFIFFIVTQ